MGWLDSAGFHWRYASGAPAGLDNTAKLGPRLFSLPQRAVVGHTRGADGGTLTSQGTLSFLFVLGGPVIDLAVQFVLQVFVAMFKLLIFTI